MATRDGSRGYRGEEIGRYRSEDTKQWICRMNKFRDLIMYNMGITSNNILLYMGLMLINELILAAFATKKIKTKNGQLCDIVDAN